MQLNDIVGLEVSAVCFVRDYFELHFDGPILRCLAISTIEDRSAKFVFPDNGSRDLLSSLIGKTIVDLSYQEDVKLVVSFQDDLRMTIRLDSESRPALEAMHFVPEINGPIQVW